MKVLKNQKYKCIADFEMPEALIRITSGEVVFVTDFDRYGISIIYKDHNICISTENFADYFEILQDEKNEKTTEKPYEEPLTDSQDKICDVMDSMKDLLLIKIKNMVIQL